MIFYFSGTGNTWQVAMQLARLLEEEALDITRCGDSVAASGKRIVWCFPTYSWGVPPVMVDFIRRVNIEGGASLPHYMVTTCGDDIGKADRQWRQLMQRKGWEGRAAFSVIMPNTYVLMKGFDTDTRELETPKLSAAPAQVSAIAQAIEGGQSADSVVRGKFASFKTSVIYPWFVRFDMSPKPFHATGACISCGLCAAHCPKGNIEMDADGHPRWGDDCALCLRCYHICPRHAVAYGKATTTKGQYLNPLFKKQLFSKP